MMEQFTFHIIKTNIIAALFIVLVQILSHFIKGKYSSMWKYFMWLAISVFLLIPFNPVNSISAIKLEITPPASHARYDSGKEAGQVSETAKASGRAVNSESFHSENSSANPEELRSADSPADSASPVSSLVNPVSSQRSSIRDKHTIPLASSEISLYGFLQLFSVIWISGIVILALYKTMLYRFSLGHLMRWSMPVTDKNLLKLYRYCCIKKHIARPPKLMIGSKLSSPVLAGLRKTRLYLPSENYSMEELQLVFYHELSHYKCRDLWYRMLLLVVTTIYWFNPLLYKMEKEAEKDIENLCDSSVIRFCEKPERLAYNRLLLKTAAFHHHVPYLATSLNDSTLVFKERILYMVNSAALNSRITPALLLTAGLIFVHTGVGCTIKDAPILQKMNYSSSTLDIVKNSGTSKTDNPKVSNTTAFSHEPAVVINTTDNLQPNDNKTAPPADTSVSQTEPPEPVVAAVSKTVYSTGTVNIRSGAGTEFAVIGTTSNGMQLVQTGISDNGWVQISWNGMTAYVSQDYVTADVPAESQVQALSGEGEIIGTILTIDRASYTNTNVTIQTQDGNIYSFTSGHGTTSLDYDAGPGDLVKIRYRDSLLCQMFDHVDPANITETFTEVGQVLEVQNDMTLIIQNNRTYWTSAPRKYSIGHLSGMRDYMPGDYVLVTYAGDYNNPYVVDVQKQDASPVTISPNGTLDSANTAIPDETAGPEQTPASEETSDTPVLLYDGSFCQPIITDDQGQEVPFADYYTVQVSNATKSSFDFSITLCDCYGNAKSTDVSGTAVFTGDTNAEYSGNGYNLYFSLSGSLPVITYMYVSGYGPLDGIQLYNNKIPGYDFN